MAPSMPVGELSISTVKSERPVQLMENEGLSQKGRPLKHASKFFRTIHWKSREAKRRFAQL